MKKPFVLAVQLLGAIAFAGLCIAIAFSEIDLARLRVVWFTVFLFGVLWWETRRLSRRGLYWIIMVGALAVHTFLLLTIQKFQPSLPLVYYVILGSLEAAAVLWCLLKPNW